MIKTISMPSPIISKFFDLFRVSAPILESCRCTEFINRYHKSKTVFCSRHIEFINRYQKSKTINKTRCMSNTRLFKNYFLMDDFNPCDGFKNMVFNFIVYLSKLRLF